MFDTMGHICRLLSHIHLEIKDSEHNDVNSEAAWPRIARWMLIQHIISNVNGLKLYICGMNPDTLVMKSIHMLFFHDQHVLTVIAPELVPYRMTAGTLLFLYPRAQDSVLYVCNYQRHLAGQLLPFFLCFQDTSGWLHLATRWWMPPWEGQHTLVLFREHWHCANNQ